MKFTYFGHACFSVIISGKTILFDPFITGNELATIINIDEINADYILVTHGHFDHSLDVVSIAAKTGATVIGCWELCDLFGKKGVAKTQPLNPGGKFNFEFGVVKAVAAQHSSSFSDGSYAGTACGYVIKSAEGNFYYSGDTALTMDMSLIPKFADLAFAVFPIGDVLTMGPEDAITAAELVATNKVIGVHYDTFGFIKIDKHDAVQQFEGAGVELLLPGIGETIEV
jgi:L-ascorbate metabolism protein UlaG (beta-lactamase superfamily)